MGKAAAVGVGSGVVAGVGAYQVNKAIDHYSLSQPSSFGSTHTSYHKGKKQPTFIIKKCYTRIGANCPINPDHGRYIVQTQNNTANGTATVYTSQIQVNYRKDMRDCVQNGECKPKKNPGEDTNIGECTCRSGYIREPKSDICIKEKRSNGAGNLRLESLSSSCPTCSLKNLKFLYFLSHHIIQ